MSVLSKSLYVLTRSLSMFGLPVLRRLRSGIYSWHFRARGMNVSDRVMIVAAHRSAAAGIKFGSGVELGADTYLDYSGNMLVGDNVAISEGARIFTHNHAIREGYSNWHNNPVEFSSLEIGADAWIGASSIVLPQVGRIGRGAVIGAGAVLTKDVQDYEVYAGNPARCLFVRSITPAQGE